MGRSPRTRILAPLAVGLGAALGSSSGCVTLPPEPPPRAARDPCADRLHDLCGLLTLYWFQNKDLPMSLEDLRAVAEAGTTPEFDCPSSKKRYLFRREGFKALEGKGILILRDPPPAHGGIIWGIAIAKPSGPLPFTARVVGLPEKEVAK